MEAFANNVVLIPVAAGMFYRLFSGGRVPSFLRPVLGEYRVDKPDTRRGGDGALVGDGDKQRPQAASSKGELGRQEQSSWRGVREIYGRPLPKMGRPAAI